MDFSLLETCPACNSSWKDKPIPEESRWMFGKSKWFSRVIAISSLQQDRCIAYQCPDCNTCWDRDTGQVVDGYESVSNHFAISKQ
jgi:hypothetical protein